MRLRVGEGGGRLERDGVQEGSLRLRGGGESFSASYWAEC